VLQIGSDFIAGVLADSLGVATAVILPIRKPRP
jgi:hypothetical protein